MSTWVTIRNDVEADFQDVITFLDGTTLGSQLVADAEAAWAELKSISEQQLKGLVTTLGSAALTGLASGGAAGALTATLAAAPAALESIGTTITNTTLNTLVTSIVNSVEATPAMAPSPSPTA